jgi:YD repeat-containing protein
MVDPSGPARAWSFFTDGSGPFGALSRYEARTSATGTVLHRRDFTYAQDGLQRKYIGAVVTTIEPATANLQSKTDQVLDDYGNVTQTRLYNYGNLTTPARTYTNTYLTNANYTSRYIRNRLLTSTVTDGTNNVTLVSNTYDGGTLTNVTNMVAHDAAYGTSFTYRGNLTRSLSPGSIRNISYDIGGNVVSSNDGYGHTLTNTYSAATQYTAPDKLSPGSDSLATNYTYTQFLGVSTVTAPGATASIQYDSYARPTQTTSPLGAITTYTYDTTNRLTTATTGTRIVKTTIDGLGRTIKVETGDSSGTKSVVETEYDSCACSPLGKLKRVSRPYAPGATVYWTTYTFDALGRPTQITLPDGSVSTYSYAGNTTTVT